MDIPRSYNPKPGIVSEREFLLWASGFAESVRLTRTSHPNAEVFALGWNRAVNAIARSFRSLALG